jgi:hypothetical protein
VVTAEAIVRVARLGQRVCEKDFVEGFASKFRPLL